MVLFLSLIRKCIQYLWTVTNTTKCRALPRLQIWFFLHLGFVYAGIGPDYRVLVTNARKSAQKYYLTYRELSPVAEVAREAAGVMQEYTQSGGVRPFGVSLLVAGYDHEGPQLYQVDPSGMFVKLLDD